MILTSLDKVRLISGQKSLDVYLDDVATTVNYLGIKVVYIMAW